MIRLTEFGRWLREHRKAAGLTQEQLAGLARCSKSYVSMLESSDEVERPSLKRVDAFADALLVKRHDARVAAGYAFAAPEELESDDLQFAWKLQGILSKVPADRRPQLREAIQRFAESALPLVS